MADYASPIRPTASGSRLLQQGRTRQRRGRALAEITEPVPENQACGAACGDVLPERALGQFGSELRPALDPRPGLEFGKPRFGRGVEITDGNRRIMIALAGEKAG